MLKGVAGALVTGSLLMGSAASAAPGTAVGFADGWTTVMAASCGPNRDDLFVVYPQPSSSSKYMLTSDPTWYVPLSILCSNGKKFAVHVTKGVWDAITYAPAF